MKLSVVIPVFNEERYITKCLSHLFNQSILPDEVIVVDNNSTDKTVSLAKKFPVIIVKEKVQGMIPARNKGFNTAKHPVIGRIDADTYVHRNWVKELKKNFEEDPDLIAFSGLTYFRDRKLNALHKLPNYIYYNSFKQIVGSDCLYGMNMAIRKDAWERVKQFVCANDRMVHEDGDLAIHIAKLNLGKVTFDPDFIVEISTRRWAGLSRAYVEYPYRYFKTLLLHRNSVQKLKRGHQRVGATLRLAKHKIYSMVDRSNF